jgi:hypothetical protein
LIGKPCYRKELLIIQYFEKETNWPSLKGNLDIDLVKWNTKQNNEVKDQRKRGKYFNP